MPNPPSSYADPFGLSSTTLTALVPMSRPTTSGRFFFFQNVMGYSSLPASLAQQPPKPQNYFFSLFHRSVYRSL